MRITVGVTGSDGSAAARTRRRTTRAVRSWRRTFIAWALAYALGMTSMLVMRPVDVTIGLHVVPRENSRTTCVAPGSEDGRITAGGSTPDAAGSPNGSTVATRPSGGAE